MHKLILALIFAATLTGCATKYDAARWPVQKIKDPVTEEAPDVIMP